MEKVPVDQVEAAISEVKCPFCLAPAGESCGNEIYSEDRPLKKERYSQRIRVNLYLSQSLTEGR